jgi:hypothetical protein
MPPSPWLCVCWSEQWETLLKRWSPGVQRAEMCEIMSRALGRNEWARLLWSEGPVPCHHWDFNITWIQQSSPGEAPSSLAPSFPSQALTVFKIVPLLQLQCQHRKKKYTSLTAPTLFFFLQSLLKETPPVLDRPRR